MGAVAIRVFDSEAGTTTEYAYNASPVRIGRNPLNDLTLPFPFVSGWHAVVRFDGNEAKFFDLGSTNGTVHNGRKVAAGEPIVIDGEVSLTIGKLELRVRRGTAVAVAEGHPPRQGAAARASGAFAPTSAQSGPAMPAAVHPPEVSSAPPAAGTAAVDMADVHQAMHRLRPHYEAYQSGWSTMLRELGSALSSMPAQTRTVAVSILQREFPEIVSQPAFQSIARESGVFHEGASQGRDTGRSNAVARLSGALRPGEPAPSTSTEEERFLERVEDVLRASAKALVELQKGQEQFGAQMGVRTIKEFTALHAAGSSEAVLAYLLDWRAGGATRTQELVGSYADLMIHHVALINGLMEGVRGLLARLSPQEIERGVQGGWAGKTGAAWKRYVEKHEQLTGDDNALSSVVFGPEFARAYAEVGGEGTSS